MTICFPNPRTGCNVVHFPCMTSGSQSTDCADCCYLSVEFETCSRCLIRCKDTGCHPSTSRRTHPENTNTKVRVPFGSPYVIFSSSYSLLPRPTVEARLAAYSSASKLAEDARVKIRRQHQASLKKGKYARHSTEYDKVSTVFLVSNRNEYEISLQVPKTARPSHCRRGYGLSSYKTEHWRKMKD